ncbi:sugar ABC transporter substrate-binding protein [Paenibacillus rhizophilus]|nr:extracellular solute-binding protein [Paenibacillus rhizophilus]
MKKKLGLVMLSTLMMFTLAACGGNAATNSGNQSSNVTGSQTNTDETAAMDELKPEEGAELRLWTFITDLKPFTDYALKEFEQKYNIKVTVEDVGYWDSIKRLSTDGPAGVGADVFGLQTPDVANAVQSGLVLPNDYFEEDTKSMNKPDTIAAATHDGILYGYPWNVYTFSLYYNKDLVKDAKLETWDDIIAFSKKFNDVKNNKFGFLYEPKTSAFDVAFMTGYGGYIFGNNETDVNDIGINNEGSVKGMQFIQSLREIIPLELADVTNNLKEGLWSQGKLAINMDGSWAIGEHNKQPFPVGVLPMPKLAGGENAMPLAGSTGYYVSSYSKYPNAAKLLAHFITTKEMQIKNNELTGALPAADVTGTEQGMRNDELTQGFLKQIASSHRFPGLYETKYVWPALDAAIADVWKGGDPKAALDKAAGKLKTDIANQK